MSNIEKSVKSLMSLDAVKQKFNEILGNNAPNFIASVVQISNTTALQKCDANSILSAAIIAASLNLSVNPGLGQAAIIPFGDKATFQIMYKGLIQLALRSGQIQTINVSEVHDGEIISNNIVTGEIKFSEQRFLDAKVIGYVAYIRLINGFEKMLYMTKEEIERHGKKYSKMFNTGLWKNDFDKMACKTVLKMLLDKYSPKSIDMQRALTFDNKEIKVSEGNIDIDFAEVNDVDFKEQEIENKNINIRTNENNIA